MGGLITGVRRAAVVVALALLTASGLAAAGAAAVRGSSVKVIHYHGVRLTVPSRWPVYDLAKHPDVCVRLNRHAVYLGAPGASERCPARAIGRTEAIVLQLLPSRGRAPLAAIPAAAESGGGSSGWWLDRRNGVLVTATWRERPALIQRALGLRSLRVLEHPAGELPWGGAAAARLRAQTSSASAAAIPGAVYTGKGFDACSTPSPSAMSAWHSAYRAIGVYIGGANEASCAGVGLSAGWVSRESAQGWHLFPIYVGRQAPSNYCGCSGIASASAARQGRFAASDAVKQARSLGLGRGNPLYFDMEGYPHTASNTSAVLRFLAAWTTQLHAHGYLSGVYSSVDSGIADLVSKVATGYVEPDELWVARYNGEYTTSDPNVPSAYWPDHERLHQVDGGHNERHGGVTINIDGDYLDAATAAAGTAPGMSSRPVALMPPTISGTPLQGRKLTMWHGSWSGVPTSYADQWEDCNRSGRDCTPIPGAVGQTYVVAASDIGHSLRVVERASNPYGTGARSASKSSRRVLNPGPLWLRTASGRVYAVPGTPFYGSPYGSGFRGSTITGAAATPDARGYWLVDSAGAVFNFGDAPVLPVVSPTHPIIGMVAAPGGGYWLYTAAGDVYAASGTAYYGSPAGSGFTGSSITGMAATADGQGYWLVDSAGTVYPFGDAATASPVAPAHRIAGMAASPAGGYWLYTRAGNVYPRDGAHWYGAPAASGSHGSPIVGLVASPDGRGYWMADAAGAVVHYGDALAVAPLKHTHAITGIFR